MVSSHEKGAAFVREAIENYKSLGYKTWKPSNKAVRYFDKKTGQWKMYSMTQDIAEAFDILCWNSDIILFVQVKSNEGHACVARQKIDSLGLPNCDDPHGFVYRVVLMRIPRKKYTFVSWTSRSDGEWERDEFGPLDKKL